VAVALFFLVKGVNQMRRREEAAPPPPAAPSPEVRLLGEIRDLLRR
jgi:large conductance mechanosensitive channel